MSDVNNQPADDTAGKTDEQAVDLTIGETPAEKPAPAAVVADDAGALSYEPTGDAGLDLALDFIGKAGIAADHPAMVAAQKGDFSILRATLAQKGTQGWEQFVNLGEQAYKRNADAASARTEATKKAVVEVAGSAEDWAAVQTWAAANATADEKAEINALLNAGGVKAKAAAKYLVDAYHRAGGTKTPADGTGSASRSSGPATDNGPLSPGEYVKAVAALNVKLRGRVDGSPEYDALQRRRLAYRG